MEKKIVAFLCAVLMLATVAAPAFAAEFEAPVQKSVSGKTQTKADTKGTYENLEYEISGGEVTITGYVTAPEGALVIPEKIEGYPVTTIGAEAFYDCDSITSVKMPSVQTIGVYAFWNCHSLTSIEMPNVETIGYEAFCNCDSLTSVEMPKVKEVAGNSFINTNWYNKLTDEFCIFGDGVLVKYCGTTTDVTVPDNVKCVAGFYQNESIVSVEIPTAETIGDWAFYSCNYLTSVEMPQVQTIGYEAFWLCNSLTSVEMPQVQKVDGSAFVGCGSLTSFIISSDNENYSADGGILYDKDKSTLIAYPSAAGDIKIADSVQTIGDEAFMSCSSLTSVEMPHVETIGVGAFYACDSLESVEMPKVKEVAGDSFYNSKWYKELTDEFCIFGDGVLVKYCGTTTDVTVPSNVKCVAGFCENDNIVSVEMPNVETIGKWAFFWCLSLKSVKIPKVQTIGGCAFAYCDSLTSVEMQNVQTIGDNAFIYCDSLTSVKMSQVQTIGDYAFYDCDSLTSAYFYSDAPTSFGEGVFEDCADDFTIYYAEGTKGWDTPEWNGYPAYPFNPDKDLGDLNDDGKINTADAVAILKAAAEITQLDETQNLAADVNHDGKVNTADAVTILKYAAGIISEF